MELNRDAISPCSAQLPRSAAMDMLRLVRVLFRLQRLPAYRQLMDRDFPEIAKFDPGHDSVMMGYDFHLGPSGPRLIEVNTNAGGAIYAYGAEFPTGRENLPRGRFIDRFLGTFREEWRRFAGSGRPLQRIAIIDENPPEQGLFPEMVTFCELFREAGINCSIHDPGELLASRDGVFAGGDKVDLVYNRHCDFYLEEAVMSGLRQAYLHRAVCLSPNPGAYGLLADKRRMALWSDPSIMGRLPLRERDRRLVLELVPKSHLLASLDSDQTWTRRKDLIFKPVDRFGGKGVLAGASISRKRFDQLDPSHTLVQEMVPPSLTRGEDGEFKTDFRLFVYRNRCFGIAARLYRGQVTNLRTPGGGFARVQIGAD